VSRPRRPAFTDCLPTFFIKSDKGSQGAAIENPLCAFRQEQRAARGLPAAPAHASKLVKDAVEKEVANLLGQFAEAKAPEIVTLGQEAADVPAKLAGTKPRKLEAEQRLWQWAGRGGRRSADAVVAADPSRQQGRQVADGACGLGAGAGLIGTDDRLGVLPR
jgi:hypothetical protein